MSGSFNPPNKGPGPVPDPSARAQTWAATINGQSNTLYDYFVEGVDTFGNTNRSEIKHVFVGVAVPSTVV